MPKKKSGKRAAKEFEARLDEIEDFLADINAANLAAASVSRCYESAVIRTAIAFEKLMLSCLVTAINNDTSMLSQTTGIQFPKHLTDEVCEYLVVGDGYFDFRGWDGLLKVSKQFVGDTHWLVRVLKSKPSYKKTLNLLFTLRNYTAHESIQSKRRFRSEIGAKTVQLPGAWAKRQNRMGSLFSSLRSLAQDIGTNAPY